MNIVPEDGQLAKPLKTYTTGEAIFDMINDRLFDTSQSYSIESVQKRALRIIYGQGKLPNHFLLKYF